MAFSFIFEKYKLCQLQGNYKCLDYNDYETSDMLLEKIKKDYLSE